MGADNQAQRVIDRMDRRDERNGDVAKAFATEVDNIIVTRNQNGVYMVVDFRAPPTDRAGWLVISQFASVTDARNDRAVELIRRLDHIRAGHNPDRNLIHKLGRVIQHARDNLPPTDGSDERNARVMHFLDLASDLYETWCDERGDPGPAGDLIIESAP